MKRIFFLSALFCALAAVSFAQENDRIFKKFKGDLSLGYAGFLNNPDIKSGFIFAMEPKFQVLDQLAVGVKIETIILGKEIKDNSGYDNGDVKIKIYQSFLATADYYFTKNYRLRPFAGGGGGLYSILTTSTITDNTGNESRSYKFGGMIRAGVEIKHLRVGVEYNFVPHTVSANYDSAGYYYPEDSKNSFIAVKLGFCFGGGPKK